MRCSGCGSKRSAREEVEREEQQVQEEVARLQREVQELQLMRQLGKQGQDKRRSPDLPHMDYKPQP